jgi:hypothetical protein
MSSLKAARATVFAATTFCLLSPHVHSLLVFQRLTYPTTTPLHYNPYKPTGPWIDSSRFHHLDFTLSSFYSTQPQHPEFYAIRPQHCLSSRHRSLPSYSGSGISTVTNKCLASAFRPRKLTLICLLFSCTSQSSWVSRDGGFT